MQLKIPDIDLSEHCIGRMCTHGGRPRHSSNAITVAGQCCGPYNSSSAVYMAKISSISALCQTMPTTSRQQPVCQSYTRTRSFRKYLYVQHFRCARKIIPLWPDNRVDKQHRNLVVLLTTGVNMIPHLDTAPQEPDNSSTCAASFLRQCGPSQSQCLLLHSCTGQLCAVDGMTAGCRQSCQKFTNTVLVTQCKLQPTGHMTAQTRRHNTW